MNRSEARLIAEEFYKLCEENYIFKDKLYDVNGASKFLCIPLPP